MDNTTYVNMWLINSMLTTYFKNDYDKMNHWIESPHPYFNNETPYNIVKSGHSDDLRKFLESELGVK